MIFALRISFLTFAAAIFCEAGGDDIAGEIRDALKTLEFEERDLSVAVHSSEKFLLGTTPIVRDFFSEPLRLVAESERMGTAFLDGKTAWKDAAAAVWSWLPAGAQKLNPSDPTQAKPDPAVTEQMNALPKDLREGLAIMLSALAEAARLRKEALSRLTADDETFLRNALPALARDDVTVGEDPDGRRVKTAKAMERVDMAKLAQASAVIAAGIDLAMPLLKRAAANAGAGEIFQCKTKAGLIRIGGMQDDVYTDSATLQIDLGGNDTYRAPVGSSLSSPCGVAISIDISGNDRYESDRMGDAILGCGFLIDVEGNDRYQAKSFALGAVCGGSAIVVDEAGDDTYVAEDFAMGAAMWGVGLLLDRGGDDSYEARDMSQGYGTVQGVGILADVSGDDRYRAGNFAHGVGAGRRHLSRKEGGKASIGNASFFGGVGMIVDGAGDDRHEGGSQQSIASAYFYGIGIVDDRAGNDTYRAERTIFCGGGAAHYGMALFRDKVGNDAYDIGDICSAYDHSVSLFLEAEGNDIYRIGRLAAADNALSRSVFVDGAGDDTYHTKTLASADGEKALIIFLDLAGRDTYEVASPNNWKDGAETVLRSPPVDGKRPGGILRRDR